MKQLQILVRRARARNAGVKNKLAMIDSTYKGNDDAFLQGQSGTVKRGRCLKEDIFTSHGRQAGQVDIRSLTVARGD